MTIRIGTVQLLTGQAVCSLVAPAALDTVTGLRLANATASVLVLENITQNGQDQQYLMPAQQMVYKSPNISSPPVVYSLTATPATVQASLFVEWSDDPETDFLGTYPVALPA